MDFADALSDTIEWHYTSNDHFAEAADVASSSVSRWCHRKGVPSVKKIQQMAPYILDRAGKAIPAGILVDLAHPHLAEGRAASIDVGRPGATNPLARELDRMLADDSPMPADQRAALSSLADSLMNPYRTYMRRRRAG